MITTQFLLEWALRSSALIVAGALLVRVLRVKDAASRLAAWISVLCASLVLPALSVGLPELSIPQPPAPAAANRVVMLSAPIATQLVSTQPEAPIIEWETAFIALYALMAAVLLLKLIAGSIVAGRIRSTSLPTGQLRNGVAIRESDRIAAPVAIGVLRPAVILPVDWREWNSQKLEAVLAHELSHIRRRDPAVQFLSAVHCALLWHSPLSWYLHRQIVRLAEEVSDDAAVAATNDPVSYARVLLEFMQRGVRGPRWTAGVSMARYGQPEHRIQRVLDAAVRSHGITFRGVVAMIVVGVPFAYFAAAARPAQTPPVPPNPPSAPVAPAAPRSTAGSRVGRYVISLNDSHMSASFDSRDSVNPASLRARYGSRFAWFRRDGSEYLITDSETLRDLERAMELQENVNRMQDQVNELQNRVNQLQSEVNAKQDGVNSLQNSVNRRQDIANRIQDAVNRGDRNSIVKELEKSLQDLRSSSDDTSQEAVNRRQAAVNEEQSRVNKEQHKVNAEQEKVNAEQHRVSVEIERRVQEMFDSAIRKGKAQRLK